MTFIKNFADWFKLKPILDNNNCKPPFFKEKEIWWTRIGENIGSETSGKSDQFTRPVLIYTKLSKYSFFGIPITSQLTNSKGEARDGSWYQLITLKNQNMLVMLNQIRVFDYKRLDKQLGQLDSKDYDLVVDKFNNLYCKNKSL